MIKIIASDLDGTLLQNGAQQLSPRTVPLIRRLAEYNIPFVAASGRQYPNLVHLFGEAAKDMAFLCENGAYVVYRGQVIQKSCMSSSDTFPLIHDILNRPGCEVLISGEKTSYLMPKTQRYYDRIKNIVKNNVTRIHSVSEIPEEIVKISVYEEAGIANHSADYFLSRWNSKLKCTISGFCWLDFVNPDVNKGMALAALLKHLSISPADACAFGDNYNDLEMLSFVRHGYIMDNAAEELRKQYALHTACVEDTLEEILSELTHSRTII